MSINPQVNTNFLDGGQPDIKAIGIGDLSAGCKFTASTYGMIIGIYRAVPQLGYSHVGIDRNLFKTDATDFPIPELDSIGMQTQYRCGLSYTNHTNFIKIKHYSLLNKTIKFKFCTFFCVNSILNTIKVS